MPELPDITIYVERVQALAHGQQLLGIRLASPFVLRTVEPAPQAFVGHALDDVHRIGKRIVLGFSDDLYAVMHLMIAGRLHWRAQGCALPRRVGMLAFDFPSGSLLMTEASTKHRASLHLVSGTAGLDAFTRAGVDLLQATPEALAAALRRQSRTLKRALTDPAVIDGVGNAYSDEILHRAGLSPFALTGTLTDADVLRLHRAAVLVLTEWITRLREEAGDKIPEKVTAFRREMRVHGKYGEPCPVCGAPVQRIVYAENEANYCPRCQTGDRILADRSLSRLLKNDWPRTLEELEEQTTGRRR
jgi:formamidopyrimidine-DNA glycosylase